MAEDHSDAIQALSRLVQRNVLTIEEARSAAQLITGDPQVEFPPRPAPRASPAAPPTPPPAGSDGPSPP